MTWKNLLKKLLEQVSDVIFLKHYLLFFNIKKSHLNPKQTQVKHLLPIKFEDYLKSLPVV